MKLEIVLVVVILAYCENKIYICSGIRIDFFYGEIFAISLYKEDRFGQ
jgi:hypothetical protein